LIYVLTLAYLVTVIAVFPYWQKEIGYEPPFYWYENAIALTLALLVALVFPLIWAYALVVVLMRYGNR
jgi:hypothetical protein